MPNIKVIRQGIAALPNGPPLVVALTGGTTGIGSYIARALARTFAKHGSKLRVYIVGRKASRAQTLIAYGREISPGSEWRFIPTTDLTLMSEVNRVSQEIILQEEATPFAGGPARLDVLYMSQALSPLQPSPRTYILIPNPTPSTNLTKQLQRNPSTRNSVYSTTRAST
jgi:NAD(P)-dependent dehydrogenase (short-subunit alcohol dehydrogenase family)